MAWSLTYQAPEEPELLDLFFAAVGKALYLSNAFESKCSSLLNFIKLADYCKQMDSPAAFALAQTLTRTMLGATISGLGKFPDFTTSDIRCLDKGREARNLIAHEGADVGHLSAPATRILKAFGKLRAAVADLANADNLVSQWLYFIEDSENTYSSIQEKYPEWVDRWVFRQLDSFLETYQPEERQESITDRLLRVMKEPRRYPDYVQE